MYFYLHHFAMRYNAVFAHLLMLLWILLFLLPGDRISPVGLTMRQGVASVQSRNGLSNARIRSGLGKCETWSRIAKETHDWHLSQNRVGWYLWNVRGHDPDHGVGRCRALTCKTKLILLVHSSMTVHASLHLMWLFPANHLWGLHTQTN